MIAGDKVWNEFKDYVHGKNECSWWMHNFFCRDESCDV